MPSYVVKPRRDEDFYVYWSEVVEAPLCWGPRQEVREYLETRPDSDRSNIDERLDRADATGTSALWPRGKDPIFGWNDDTIIYQQQGILSREGLRTLCLRFSEANPGSDVVEVIPDVSDLLTPFED